MPCVSNPVSSKSSPGPVLRTLRSWLHHSSAPAGALSCGGGQDFSISQRPSHPPHSESSLCGGSSRCLAQCGAEGRSVSGLGEPEMGGEELRFSVEIPLGVMGALGMMGATAANQTCSWDNPEVQSTQVV